MHDTRWGGATPPGRLIGACVAAVAGLGCTAALAQDSPPPTTHRAPDGIAANAPGGRPQSGVEDTAGD